MTGEEKEEIEIIINEMIVTASTGRNPFFYMNEEQHKTIYVYLMQLRKENAILKRKLNELNENNERERNKTKITKISKWRANKKTR